MGRARNIQGGLSNGDEDHCNHAIASPQQLTRISSAMVLVDGVVECPDVGRLRKGLCHRLSAVDGLCLLLCSRLSASSNRPHLTVQHVKVVQLSGESGPTSQW